jgi:dermatan 4-sulfotransferase 1
MIGKIEADRLNATYYSFSFVRNPFDRVISCYHNKIISNPKLSPAMIRMGMKPRMPFDDFVRTLVLIEDRDMDVHLIPQSEILAIGNKVIPKFVGRFESLARDWQALAEEMTELGLPALGQLPAKNVRREGQENLLDYFSDPELIHLVKKKYAKDLELFYAGVTESDLITGKQPRDLPPLRYRDPS